MTSDTSASAYVGDVLAREIKGCTACAELAATRSQVVPGVLPLGARLVLVGEAPGATEDDTGVPFAGRAGQLLDGVLAVVGLDRSTVGVVNVLKCRPPGNRRPARTEVASCRPWLRNVSRCVSSRSMTHGILAWCWRASSR